MQLLKGKQPLHFTALSAVNRIIDICIVNNSYEQFGMAPQTKEDDKEKSNLERDAPKRKSFKDKVRESKLGRHGSEKKSRDSTKTSRQENSSSSTSSGDKCEANKTKTPKEKSDHEAKEGDTEQLVENLNQTPLEILTSCDPGPILNVLHNSITMHRRIIGTRYKCTPSTRWRHCTHHCLQILSARVLALMCHGQTVQHKVVSDGHLKTLVEGLDPNHDPVSFCPHTCMQLAHHMQFWNGSKMSKEWMSRTLVIECLPPMPLASNQTLT